MSRRWRAYHAELPHAPGAVVELDPSETHHVRRVLRLRAGTRVGVFDGRGREWLATLLADRAERAALRLDEEVLEPVETGLEVRLYQGLCRPERMDWVVQKATEIGVSAVLVLGTPTARRLERWRRIAIEACKQSGRRHLPAVDRCDVLPAPPAAGVRALLLEPGPGPAPLGALLEPPAEAVWLAVGPEGGFGERELGRWREAGWRPASLGPRTLRTETAGLVAAALVLHHWADLGAVVDTPGAGS